MRNSIRKALYKDIPGIHELLKQVNLVHHLGRPDLFKKANKYTDEEIQAIIDDPGQLLLVSIDESETVTGHAFCIYQQQIGSNLLTDVKTLYIDDICVDENHRRQHIGQQLFAEVKQIASNTGCYNITLNVWALNPSALSFYQSLGMQTLKTTLETKLG
jgi:ribosomal protein S18 acetylase RimI-like enzyme